MICTYCRESVPETANVCGYCGHQLKSQSLSTQDDTEVMAPTPPPGTRDPVRAPTPPVAARLAQWPVQVASSARGPNALAATAAAVLMVSPSMPWWARGSATAYDLTMETLFSTSPPTIIDHSVQSIGLAVVLLGAWSLWAVLGVWPSTVRRVIGVAAVALAVSHVITLTSNGVDIGRALDIGPVAAALAGLTLLVAPSAVRRS